MEVKPVKSYSAPGYPTQDFLRDHPELLRLIPKRWRHNRAVLTALSMAAMLIISVQCRSDRGAPFEKGASRVAPIFVHGEGRGSFGCVAVAAPLFLSEEEAFQIVQDEAGKADLNFKADSLVVQDASVPLTYTGGVAYIGKDVLLAEGPGSIKRPILLDGHDPERQIAFEFVSLADYHEWAKTSDDKYVVCSSAWGEDYKETAMRLRCGLQQSMTLPATAVFYDPAESDYSIHRKRRQEDSTYVRRYHFTEEMVRQYNEEQLRLQVRDFIQWLKSEGII